MADVQTRPVPATVSDNHIRIARIQIRRAMLHKQLEPDVGKSFEQH
jgi:hypothetical protein